MFNKLKKQKRLLTAGLERSAEELLSAAQKDTSDGDAESKNSNNRRSEIDDLELSTKKNKKRKNRAKKVVKDQDLSLLSDYALTIKYTSDT